jgi:hypothetical protein
VTTSVPAVQHSPGFTVPRRTLLLALAVGAIVEISSDLGFYGLAWAEGAALGTMTALALVAVAVGWLLPGPPGAAAGPRLLRVFTFLPAVLLAGTAAASHVVRTALDRGELGMWAGAVLALALLLTLAIVRARAATIAAAALAVGLALRAVTFARAPPGETGDMLVLVINAGHRLLDGKSPYAIYEMPWKLPLTYLPLTLLAYLPAMALHFDPRWMSALFELLVAGVAIRAATAELDARSAREHPIFLVLAAWYLLSSSLEWVRMTTAPASWAALALLLASAARDRRFSPVALGLAAATTPLAAVFAPYVVLGWLERRGLARTLRAGLVAAAVVAAFVAPFFFWAPARFIEGTVLWFNDLDRYPRLRWGEARTWIEYAGFTGLLWQHGLERWLKPLQVLSMVTLSALYLRRGSPRAAFAPFCVAAFLLMMVCNTVIWPYYYEPAVIAAMVAVAVADQGSLPTLRPDAPR